jgi:hypothetical protein
LGAAAFRSKALAKVTDIGLGRFRRVGFFPPLFKKSTKKSRETRLGLLRTPSIFTPSFHVSPGVPIIRVWEQVEGGEIAKKGELTGCLPKFSGLKRPNRF